MHWGAALCPVNGSIIDFVLHIVRIFAIISDCHLFGIVVQNIKLSYDEVARFTNM